MKSTARKSTTTNGLHTPSSSLVAAAANEETNGHSSPVVIDDDEEDCVLVCKKEKLLNGLLANNVINGGPSKIIEIVKNGSVKRRSIQSEEPCAIKKAKLDNQLNKSLQTLKLSNNDLKELLERRVNEIILKHPMVAAVKLDLEQLKKTREFWKNQAEKLLVKQRELEKIKNIANQVSGGNILPENIVQSNSSIPKQATRLVQINSNLARITAATPTTTPSIIPKNQTPLNKTLPPIAVSSQLKNNSANKNILSVTNKEAKTSNRGNGLSNGNTPSNLVAKENKNGVIDLTSDNCSFGASTIPVIKPPQLLSPSGQCRPNGAKDLPARPVVKIQTIDQGIVLTWSMGEGDTSQCEEAKSYELHSYQHDAPNKQHRTWKKIGTLDALPLPMACTLKSLNNHHYFFSIRSVDNFKRFGPFSEPVSTLSTIL